MTGSALLTIQVVNLKPVGVRRRKLDGDLDNLAILLANLGRNILTHAQDDLGILLGQPAEEGGDTLKEKRVSYMSRQSVWRRTMVVYSRTVCVSQQMDKGRRRVWSGGEL